MCNHTFRVASDSAEQETNIKCNSETGLASKCKGNTSWAKTKVEVKHFYICQGNTAHL